MSGDQRQPSAVLLCHDDDPIDREGLASWLASSMHLAGIIEIQSSGALRRRALKRLVRKQGIRAAIDVLAFRLAYQFRSAASDTEWRRSEVQRLRERYRADLTRIPRLTVTDPNSAEVRDWLRRLDPDLMIARCKLLLKPDVYEIPKAGTFVLHPGICPEYRNSHGCFWAIARRDLDHVGMTLLKIDRGVDTGPVFLRASYPFDEVRESHVVIQYRAVTENLDAIADVLKRVSRGEAAPIVDASPRQSAVWGQPTWTAYRNWKAAIKQERSDADRLTVVP
jgi:folate-dependent phosphoribosylglycinamide formyltransferase PurN